MEKMLDSLINYGALGIVAGISLLKSFQIMDKLLDYIKSNTAALSELCALIKQIKN